MKVLQRFTFFLILAGHTGVIFDDWIYRVMIESGGDVFSEILRLSLSRADDTINLKEQVYRVMLMYTLSK